MDIFSFKGYDMKVKTEWADVESVKVELLKLDFHFWFKRTKIAEAKKKIEAILKKRVRPSDFKKLREDCSWWKNQEKPRRWPSKNRNLDANGWQDLRTAVKALLVELQGRTLDEAVAIVSMQCPCNRFVLDGLNSDLHVWEKE